MVSISVKPIQPTASFHLSSSVSRKSCLALSFSEGFWDVTPSLRAVPVVVLVSELIKDVVKEDRGASPPIVFPSKYGGVTG